MFAKRPAPVIGKLPNSFMSGGIWQASISPTSPLECKIISPRGPINCDLTGVGLGIVAAMEKYSDQSSCRSDPVPVNPPKILLTSKKGDTEENEEGSLEGYTFVTGRGPDNKRFSRVYSHGSDQRSSKWKKTSLFTVSTPRFGDFPTHDFLSNCDMCQKKLIGKDIYMYRGEKGFCSPECRHKQIVMDEKKDKYCTSTQESALKLVGVSRSPCQNGGIIFSPEIIAM